MTDNFKEREDWIKLHRCLTNTSFKKKPLTVALFIDLLMTAKHEPFKVIIENEEVLIDRGMVATGRKKLAENTGLSEQNVRTSLNLLKSTNTLTIKSFKNLSIITINNWAKYQPANQQTNQQLTNNQPTANQQLTTRKESIDNRVKKKENIYINFDKFMSVWNSLPQGFSKILDVSDSRKEKIRKRVSQVSNFLECFEMAVDKILESDFLCGEGNRGWKPNFDFMIANDRNYLKIIEGGFGGNVKANSTNRMHDKRKLLDANEQFINQRREKQLSNS